MDWKFLFEPNKKKVDAMNRVIDTMHEEFGSEMDPEIAISCAVCVLMEICSSAGMNKDDFSLMLDEIDDEYVGW